MNFTTQAPILLLYKNLGQVKIINNIVRKLYLYLLIPIVIIYLKYKHKNILHIQKRHSLLEKDTFNAFLSDIDLTIVIKENSNYLIILKTFFKIKKTFIMFDSPEIYYEYEFAQLKEITKSKAWNVVYTLWSIRKINWNYKSIENNPSELNVLKKNRAIKISLSKILADNVSKTKTFYLSDFKYLRGLADIGALENENQTLCYYSFFLETNTVSSIQLILNVKEIRYFNSLMPDESYESENLELKKIIVLYEILLTRASMRIDEVFSIKDPIKEEWISRLVIQSR